MRGFYFLPLLFLFACGQASDRNQNAGSDSIQVAPALQTEVEAPIAEDSSTSDLSSDELIVKSKDANSLEIKDRSLMSTQWNLVELNGKKISKKYAKKPFLTIDKRENRVSGNAGCNSFGGSVETTSAGKIKFDQIFATKMMCIDAMEVEDAFLEVLSKVDNYSIKGDTLSLNIAHKASSARFKAQ